MSGLSELADEERRSGSICCFTAVPDVKQLPLGRRARKTGRPGQEEKSSVPLNHHQGIVRAKACPFEGEASPCQVNITCLTKSATLMSTLSL